MIRNKKIKLYLLCFSAFLSVSFPLISFSCTTSAHISNNDDLLDSNNNIDSQLDNSFDNEKILQKNITKFQNQDTMQRNFDIRKISAKNISTFYLVPEIDKNISISYLDFETNFEKGKLSFRVELQKDDKSIKSSKLTLKNFLTPQECHSELSKLQTEFYNENLANISNENLAEIIKIPELSNRFSFELKIVANNNSSNKIEVIAKLQYDNHAIKINDGFAKKITIRTSIPNKPSDAEIKSYYQKFESKLTINPEIPPSTINKDNISSVYKIPELPGNIQISYDNFKLKSKTELSFQVQLSWTWNNEKLGKAKTIFINGFNQEIIPPPNPPNENEYDENGFIKLTEADKNIKLDSKILETIPKNQVPYSVSEELLNSAVKLPKNQPTIKWFLDINKNNDLGYIDLQVIRRDLIFNENYGQRFGDALSRTTALDSYRIKGFQKMSTLDIISERTVSIFLGTDRWYRNNNRIEPTFIQYINGFPNYLGNPDEHGNVLRSSYTRLGTGFVLDKAKNKPVYYIATNKHVLSAEQLLWINIGGGDKDNTIFDQLFNIENNQALNLRGLISFGSQKDKPETNYDESKSPFDVKNRPNETIKKINIVADFSKEFGPDMSHFSNFNKEYNNLNQANEYYEEPLDETQLNPHSKVALDMVVLRIEYINEQASPFSSWWNQRPTKIRIADERDLFNFDHYWDFNNGTPNPYVFTNIRTSWDEFKEDKPTEFGNTRIENTIYTAGYPGFRSYDDRQKNNRNKHLSFKKGVSRLSNEHKSLMVGNYNNWSVQGSITYNQKVEIQQGGASGSPVFDKNLNLIGILWGGTDVNHTKSKNNKYGWSKNNNIKDGTGKYGNVNSFSYFGTNFKSDYLGFVHDWEKDPNWQINMLNDYTFKIPNYDYIFGNKNGTYSYKSALDKYCQDDGPTYLLPNKARK